MLWVFEVTSGARHQSDMFCQIQELAEFDEDQLQRTQSYANYYVDCHDPGSWARTVQIK